MATFDSQRFHHSRRYAPVKSAIPSSSIDLRSFPQRSDQFITSNESVQLQTNHFPFTMNYDIPLYQYDLAVEELSSESNEWRIIKGRTRSANILNTLIKNDCLNDTHVVWHDEKHCLYSIKKIQTPMIVTSQNSLQRFRIESLTKELSTKEIQQYIQGSATKYPFDVVRILETLLKRSLVNRVQVIGNTLFPVGVSGNTVDGGFVERTGFFQAINLSRNMIMLNVKTKCSKFYPEMMLMDFIVAQLRHNNIPGQGEMRRINSILSGCQITTAQSGWKQVYEFNQFDPRGRSANDIRLEDQRNLVQYYEGKNIKLQHVKYPCIEAYRVDGDESICHLPVELCRIKAWQIYDKQIAESNSANRILEPEIQYQNILETIKFCDYNNENNKLCRAIGLKIDQNMLIVPGNILVTPKIEIGSNQYAEIRLGRIPLNGYLFAPQQLGKTAFTYFGEDYQQQREDIREFMSKLVRTLKRHRINFDYTFHYCRTDSQSVNDHFHRLKSDAYQFAICFTDGQNESDIKQLKGSVMNCSAINHGIPTQCVNWLKVKRLRNWNSYCDNIIRKINFKSNGINTRLALHPTLQQRIKSSDHVMFFGADVIHPTNVTQNHPSIAAVVGSGDSLCSTSSTRVCRQYPKEGKCSIETILGLSEMVQDLLEYYKYYNDDTFPNKVIFYRDGVDDGQFGKLLGHEIPLIREAFNAIYGDPTNHPKLTFIVVKKRHNTRFFYVRNRRVDNIPIGTVVDTKITHVYQQNFILNSHRAFQGVNKPPLYHVILNENNFTMEEIALLTHHQCFTDPRSSSSEAIPSVLHQADVAATKARDLFFNDDSSSIGTVGWNGRALLNPTLNDLSYDMLQIHEEIRDLPILS